MSCIEGTWVNQLGSEVVIVAGPGDRLSGSCSEATGVLSGRRYPLIGTAEAPDGAQTTPVAFTVHWTEPHCVTTWCGQYVPGPVEEIRASWLMTSPVAVADSWRATVTGYDVFHRRDA